MSGLMRLINGLLHVLTDRQLIRNRDSKYFNVVTRRMPGRGGGEWSGRRCRLSSENSSSRQFVKGWGKVANSRPVVTIFHFFQFASPEAENDEVYVVSPVCVTVAEMWTRSNYKGPGTKRTYSHDNKKQEIWSICRQLVPKLVS